MARQEQIMRRSRGRLAATAVALIAIASSVQAADQRPASSDFLSGDWLLTVGAMAYVSPRFDGSKKYGVTGFPSLSFRRPGAPIPLSTPDDSLDLSFFENRWFSIGPVLALRAGRDRHADRRLADVDNYHWTLEPGAFVEVWPIPDMVRTRIEVRHGLRNSSGFVADLSADLFHRFGAFTFSAGPRMKLADRREMRTEFGVSPAAAARSGVFTAFSPSGGAKSTGYAIAVSYDWSDRWRTTLFHRYDRLIGDAASSPIVKRIGSANQFTFGLGASYSFDLKL